MAPKPGTQYCHPYETTELSFHLDTPRFGVVARHHGFSPCLVIAPLSPFLCQVLSLPQHLAQALARSKLVLNCHVVPKEVGVLLWADTAGLVPMATDVTTRPRFGPAPFSRAVALGSGRGAEELRPAAHPQTSALGSSQTLPEPSLALPPWTRLSPILPSAVSFLRARYTQVLVIVP